MTAGARRWVVPALWIVGLLVVAAATVALLNVIFAPRAETTASTIPIRRVASPEMELLGIKEGDCAGSAMIDFWSPDLGSVDGTLTIQPWIRGWIETGAGTTRVFYGTASEAAVAMGGTEIAIGPQGDTWFKTADGGAQKLAEFRTPMGRVVWMATDYSERQAC